MSQRWEIAGYVLGPAMPDHLEVIPGRIVIRRLGEGEHRPDPRVRLNHPTLGPGEHLWSLVPAEEHLSSSWIFWVIVEADSGDEALAHANSVEIPVLETALQAIGRGTYFVLPVRLTDLNTNEGGSVWATGKFRIVSAQAAPADDFSRAVETARSLTGRPGGAELANQFAQGMHRARAALSVEDEWLAFLEFFKALEAIAAELGGPTAPAEEQLAASDQVASRLQAQLKQLAGRERLTAITDAALALNDIRHARAAVRIRRAGEVLGVDLQIVDGAVQANRTRGSHAAHALTGGEGGVGELYAGGLGRLEAVVLEFIAAYAGHGQPPACDPE